MNRIIVRSRTLSIRRPLSARRAVAVDLPAEYSAASPAPVWLVAVATVLMFAAIVTLVVGVAVTS